MYTLAMRSNAAFRGLLCGHTSRSVAVHSLPAFTSVRANSTDSVTPSPQTKSNNQHPIRQQNSQRKNQNDDSRKRLPDNHLRPRTPTHMLTLADFSPEQIIYLLQSAMSSKILAKGRQHKSVRKALNHRTIALLFSKRSTRTRVASESSTKLLGGHPLFLGSADIQMGVNETLEDTAKVVGSMVDGIMARVNRHEEVAALAEHSGIPVINALCDLYHPTQILADLLTIFEAFSPESLEFPRPSGIKHSVLRLAVAKKVNMLDVFKGKKIAWVGDTNNIINEIMVTMPRLGMEVSVASPKGYDQVDPRVWARVVEAGTEGMITRTNSPAEALKDADIVVTDTWISMGQEDEKAKRLEAFSGYQLTNALIDPHAKPDWKFLHCLPRKPEEVDDEVFYGPRSLVFPEAENRKWTTVACFEAIFGDWSVPSAPRVLEEE